MPHGKLARKASSQDTSPTGGEPLLRPASHRVECRRVAAAPGDTDLILMAVVAIEAKELMSPSEERKPGEAAFRTMTEEQLARHPLDKPLEPEEHLHELHVYQVELEM